MPKPMKCDICEKSFPEEFIYNFYHWTDEPITVAHICRYCEPAYLEVLEKMDLQVTEDPAAHC